MTLKKFTIALVAVSVAFSVSAPAFAGPNGPQDFQNKPTPKLPGPKGPGDFKLPPKKPGPKPHNHNHGAAYGAMMGIGILTAAAIAASADDDEECWEEKRKGGTVLVCAAD